MIVFLIRISLIFAATTFVGTASAGNVVEWPLSQGGNGHYYQTVAAATGITFSQARASAQAKGGDLAGIINAAENAFIGSLVVPDVELWIPGATSVLIGPWLGGSQVPGSGEPVGTWVWVNGEPFIYANWDVGQPNDATTSDENRIHYFGSANHPASTWNDYPGSPTVPGQPLPRGYVVEYLACGSVAPQGAGCSGSGGVTPMLSLQGCVTPSGQATIGIGAGLGGAAGLLVLGTTPLPLSGGRCPLLVAPQVILPIGLSGTGPGNGAFSVLAQIPATIPVGTTVYLQALIQDAAPLTGYASTARLQVSVL